jgi:hypothetical protein
MMELLFIRTHRYCLRHKVLLRYHIITFLICFGIIIRPTMYLWKRAIPVTMNVFYLSGPF